MSRFGLMQGNFDQINGIVNDTLSKIADEHGEHVGFLWNLMDEHGGNISFDRTTDRMFFKLDRIGQVKHLFLAYLRRTVLFIDRDSPDHPSALKARPHVNYARDEGTTAFAMSVDGLHIFNCITSVFRRVRSDRHAYGNATAIQIPSEPSDGAVDQYNQTREQRAVRDVWEALSLTTYEKLVKDAYGRNREALISTRVNIYAESKVFLPWECRVGVSKHVMTPEQYVETVLCVCPSAILASGIAFEWPPMDPGGFNKYRALFYGCTLRLGMFFAAPLFKGGYGVDDPDSAYYKHLFDTILLPYVRSSATREEQIEDPKIAARQALYVANAANAANERRNEARLHEAQLAEVRESLAAIRKQRVDNMNRIRDARLAVLDMQPLRKLQVATRTIDLFVRYCLLASSEIIRNESNTDDDKRYESSVIQFLANGFRSFDDADGVEAPASLEFGHTPEFGYRERAINVIRAARNDPSPFSATMRLVANAPAEMRPGRIAIPYVPVLYGDRKKRRPSRTIYDVALQRISENDVLDACPTAESHWLLSLYYRILKATGVNLFVARLSFDDPTSKAAEDHSHECEIYIDPTFPIQRLLQARNEFAPREPPADGVAVTVEYRRFLVTELMRSKYTDFDAIPCIVFQRVACIARKFVSWLAATYYYASPLPQRPPNDGLPMMLNGRSNDSIQATPLWVSFVQLLGCSSAVLDFDCAPELTDVQAASITPVFDQPHDDSSGDVDFARALPVFSWTFAPFKCEWEIKQAKDHVTADSESFRVAAPLLARIIREIGELHADIKTVVGKDFIARVVAGNSLRTSLDTKQAIRDLASSLHYKRWEQAKSLCPPLRYPDLETDLVRIPEHGIDVPDGERLVFIRNTLGIFGKRVDVPPLPPPPAGVAPIQLPQVVQPPQPDGIPFPSLDVLIGAPHEGNTAAVARRDTVPPAPNPLFYNKTNFDDFYRDVTNGYYPIFQEVAGDTERRIPVILDYTARHASARAIARLFGINVVAMLSTQALVDAALYGVVRRTNLVNGMHTQNARAQSYAIPMLPVSAPDADILTAAVTGMFQSRGQPGQGAISREFVQRAARSVNFIIVPFEDGANSGCAFFMPGVKRVAVFVMPVMDTKSKFYTSLHPGSTPAHKLAFTAECTAARTTSIRDRIRPYLSRVANLFFPVVAFNVIPYVAPSTIKRSFDDASTLIVNMAFDFLKGAHNTTGDALKRIGCTPEISATLNTRIPPRAFPDPKIRFSLIALVLADVPGLALADYERAVVSANAIPTQFVTILADIRLRNIDAAREAEERAAAERDEAVRIARDQELAAARAREVQLAKEAAADAERIRVRDLGLQPAATAAEIERKRLLDIYNSKKAKEKADAAAKQKEELDARNAARKREKEQEHQRKIAEAANAEVERAAAVQAVADARLAAARLEVERAAAAAEEARREENDILDEAFGQPGPPAVVRVFGDPDRDHAGVKRKRKIARSEVVEDPLRGLNPHPRVQAAMAEEAAALNAADQARRDMDVAVRFARRAAIRRVQQFDRIQREVQERRVQLEEEDDLEMQAHQRRLQEEEDDLEMQAHQRGRPEVVNARDRLVRAIAELQQDANDLSDELDQQSRAIEEGRRRVRRMHVRCREMADALREIVEGPPPPPLLPPLPIPPPPPPPQRGQVIDLSDSEYDEFDAVPPAPPIPPVVVQGAPPIQDLALAGLNPVQGRELSFLNDILGSP